MFQSAETMREEHAAWAILKALHANVPEATRPMSWSDMNGEQEARIRAAAKAALQIEARPLADWCEEDGPVLWWKFPIEEPTYCGTPLDLGYDVVAETTVATFRREESKSVNFMVGGWPGYHTHWTPIQIPEEPKP